jgi:hypothetical protein
MFVGGYFFATASAQLIDILGINISCVNIFFDVK